MAKPFISWLRCMNLYEVNEIVLGCERYPNKQGMLVCTQRRFQLYRVVTQQQHFCTLIENEF